jgi:adenosine deaminase
MSLATFVKKMPKTELHLHLEGAVAPGTLADLAKSNGVTLPPHNDPFELFKFDDLPSFLVVYDLVCASMRTAADFRRTTFEALERSAKAGARYVELFFSPHAHIAHGVEYTTMLEGILAGRRDAEQQYGVKCNIIPAHSRELGPEQGEKFLDMVLAHRIPEVIGIGLDYNEAPFPPAPYEKMYARARAAGLNVTAHAGESGPAENVRDSIDLLHVSRIDHGYHVTDDAALVDQCRASGICFTCCPSTTLYTTAWRDLSSPDHAIRKMIEEGLNVTIHSDDPTMFGTTLDKEYLLVAENFGLPPGKLKEMALAGVASSWLEDAAKKTMIAEWSMEIDELMRSELA